MCQKISFPEIYLSNLSEISMLNILGLKIFIVLFLGLRGFGVKFLGLRGFGVKFLGLRGFGVKYLGFRGLRKICWELNFSIFW
jgi:hypothetical protein